MPPLSRVGLSHDLAATIQLGTGSGEAQFVQPVNYVDAAALIKRYGLPLIVFFNDIYCSHGCKGLLISYQKLSAGPG